MLKHYIYFLCLKTTNWLNQIMLILCQQHSVQKHVCSCLPNNKSLTFVARCFQLPPIRSFDIIHGRVWNEISQTNDHLKCFKIDLIIVSVKVINKDKILHFGLEKVELILYVWQWGITIYSYFVIEFHEWLKKCSALKFCNFYKNVKQHFHNFLLAITIMSSSFYIFLRKYHHHEGFQTVVYTFDFLCSSKQNQCFLLKPPRSCSKKKIKILKYSTFLLNKCGRGGTLGQGKM